MVLETASSVIDLASIVVWGAVLVKGFRMADEGYGGRFTSVYPSLVGALSLFLVLGVFEWAHYEFFISGRQAASDMFVFGIKTVQLVAGILLANAVKQIYNINYATRGFMEADKDE